MKKPKKTEARQDFDDAELFDFDYNIAKFILPRLIRFREKRNSYPGDLTAKEWDKIMDKAIAGFTIIMQYHTESHAYTPAKMIKNTKDYYKCQKDIAKLFEHIGALWI